MNRKINSLRSIIDRRPFWLILFAAILSVSVYLALSASTYRIGFPLDDAWIHQTYARNFAQLGEWSYLPNQPSAGSTSPLWSFLLALGYWLRIPYLYWTFLLGGICLAALGILAARIINVCRSVGKHSIGFVRAISCIRMASGLVGGFRDGNLAFRLSFTGGHGWAAETKTRLVYSRFISRFEYLAETRWDNPAGSCAAVSRHCSRRLEKKNVCSVIDSYRCAYFCNTIRIIQPFALWCLAAKHFLCQASRICSDLSYSAGYQIAPAD